MHKRMELRRKKINLNISMFIKKNGRFSFFFFLTSTSKDLLSNLYLYCESLGSSKQTEWGKSRRRRRVHRQQVICNNFKIIPKDPWSWHPAESCPIRNVPPRVWIRKVKLWHPEPSRSSVPPTTLTGRLPPAHPTSPIRSTEDETKENDFSHSPHPEWLLMNL